MGSTTATQTQTSRIDPAGQTESSAMRNLLDMAQRAGGQMGDLSQLAQGNVGMPSAYDQQLVEQSIGASTDIAQRELQRQLEQLMAQYGEQMAARGIQGSSIEAMQSGQIYSQGLDQMANLASQGQQMGSQALMNLPFQRAGVQLGANQQLFQQLVGGSQPVMESGLQQRLNTMTTTGKVKTPINWGEMALRGASAYATSGASEIPNAAPARPQGGPG